MIDNKSLIPLLLSLAAGLSTVLGAFLIFFSSKSNKRMITFALSFSAGVMITISFTDLLPTAEQSLSKYFGLGRGVIYSLIFLIIGVSLAMLIDRFVPTEQFGQTTCNNDLSLFRVGYVSMIALFLHNFPEGIATFVSGYQNTTLGIYVAIAIAFHNIPEGISIAMPIYYATNNKKKAFYYTFLSGMAEPLGALLAFLILKPLINEIILGIIFAITSGIMIYIAFQELIPEARENGYSKTYILSLILGICIIPISHIFLV